MKYSVSSGKLFEGIEEIIANVVLEDGVHILRLKSTEKTNLYEVVGNTAVKTDEPLLETQLLEGMTVRVNLEQAYQIIERDKEELKKAWDRIDMYKHKYEDSESKNERMEDEYDDLICTKNEELRAKDEEIRAKNEELRAKDEEIRLKDIEITKLKAQLEYANEHPQRVIHIHDSQCNIDTSEEVDVDKKFVRQGELCVQQEATPKCEQTQYITNETPQVICEFIVKGAAFDQKYQTDEKFNDEFRAYFTTRTSPDVFAYLKRKEAEGLCYFKSLRAADIYDQLVKDFGKPRFDRATFVRKCSGWTPK